MKKVKYKKEKLNLHFYLKKKKKNLSINLTNYVRFIVTCVFFPFHCTIFPLFSYVKCFWPFHSHLAFLSTSCMTRCSKKQHSSQNKFNF